MVIVVNVECFSCNGSEWFSTVGDLAESAESVAGPCCKDNWREIFNNGHCSHSSGQFVVFLLNF